MNFKELFDIIENPVVDCANCLCQYCANNVEELYHKVTSEEVREDCFNCDTCRTYTGEREHINRMVQTCRQFIISNYGAERKRKQIKPIK